MPRHLDKIVNIYQTEKYYFHFLKNWIERGSTWGDELESKKLSVFKKLRNPALI